MNHPSLNGLTVLERGWLSSNNVVIHPAPGESGAVVIDSSHVTHAALSVDLVRRALAGAPLARIVNTHLHSDHCGGNAALQRAFGAPITIPPGLAAAVRQWDVERLGHDDAGSRERFTVHDTIAPGESFVAGGRRWQAVAAPGHDPHSLMYFDPANGVLVSADALWENGFGLVFPELQGESGFGDVAATLDAIEARRVQVVIPGHGAPFTDVAGALARARSRLAAYVADPSRHARHAVKVMLKYRLMARRREDFDALCDWAAQGPIVRDAAARYGGGEAPAVWCGALVRELVASGALAIEGDEVVDCGDGRRPQTGPHADASAGTI